MSWNDETKQNFIENRQKRKTNRNAEEILPRDERKQNSVVESFNLAQRL